MKIKLGFLQILLTIFTFAFFSATTTNAFDCSAGGQGSCNYGYYCGDFAEDSSWGYCVRDPSISLEPQLVAQGTVFYDKNRNGVRDSGEETLPNVTIILSNYFVTGQFPGAVNTIVSDSSGNYRFEVPADIREIYDASLIINSSLYRSVGSSSVSIPVRSQWPITANFPMIDITTALVTANLQTTYPNTLIGTDIFNNLMYINVTDLKMGDTIDFTAEAQADPGQSLNDLSIVRFLPGQYFVDSTAYYNKLKETEVARVSCSGTSCKVSGSWIPSVQDIIDQFNNNEWNRWWIVEPRINNCVGYLLPQDKQWITNPKTNNESIVANNCGNYAKVEIKPPAPTPTPTPQPLETPIPVMKCPYGAAENGNYCLNFTNNKIATPIGTEVQATGIVLGNSMALDNGPGDTRYIMTPVANTNPVLAEQTQKKMVAVMVNFNDATQTRSKAQYQDLLYTGSNSVANFWNKATYNKISITPISVQGGVLGPYKIDASKNGCDRTGWVGQVDAKALEESKLNISALGADLIMYIFPDANCLDSKGKPIGGQGWQNTKIGITYIYKPAVNLQHFYHEIGHNLNLWHAGISACPACAVDSYDDGADIMGNRAIVLPTGIHRKSGGWFSGGSIDTISESESRTVALRPLTESEGPLQMLDIPLSSGGAYYVEYRKNQGFDSSLSSAFVNHLAVRYWDGNTLSDTKLMSSTPLFTGGKYYDSANNIEIIQGATNGDSINVTVNRSVVPTDDPKFGTFDYLSETLTLDKAEFNFRYNDPSYIADKGFAIDVSASNSFIGGWIGIPLGQITNFTLTSNLQLYPEYKCDATIYWRVRNLDTDVEIEPRSAQVICTGNITNPTPVPTYPVPPGYPYPVPPGYTYPTPAGSYSYPTPTGPVINCIAYHSPCTGGATGSGSCCSPYSCTKTTGEGLLSGQSGWCGTQTAPAPSPTPSWVTTNCASAGSPCGPDPARICCDDPSRNLHGFCSGPSGVPMYQCQLR